MLTELKVNQFAIIEHLHIQFQQGLNIISGETGAGKSVLLRSLALLMGAKASSDFIRTGCQQAQIEGHFDLSERLDILRRLENIDIPSSDHELIVRRIIGPGEKNKVYLNGCLSTVSVLRDIVAPLIEVAGRNAPLIELTGQHENKNLLSKSYHLDLLDQFAKTWTQRADYESLWEQFQQTSLQISDLEKKSQLGHQQLDFLYFQRDEIIHLGLKPGEELELESTVKRLKNRQRLSHYYQGALERIDGDNDGVSICLQKLIQKGLEYSSLEPKLQGPLSLLEQSTTLIQEASAEIQKNLESLVNEGEDTEALEAKLSQWRKLQKKYGPRYEDLQKALEKIQGEISQIENAESLLQDLQQKQSQLRSRLLMMGEDLHRERVQKSTQLSHQVNEHLKDLNMKGVLFSIRIEKSMEPQSTGFSDVEFLSQTSTQDPPRPLAKVSSGGELSRILLSLKCVLGVSSFPRTYLFDEVDTGVSGVTADKVARKLKQISQGQQVICVTHLPQVAALGDHHFSIQKSPHGSSVQMEIYQLTGKKRILEIARLISGEAISKTSIAHAKELLHL